MAKQIKHTADNRRMTLAELEAFAADARSAGAADDQIIGGRIGMGGKLKELTVDIPQQDADARPQP